jgi:YD repeat-containing protein
MHNPDSIRTAGGSTMREYTIGHNWTPNMRVCPAIISAIEVRGKYPGRLIRVHAAHWILDYEYTPHGKLRSGTSPGSARPRPAGTVHLYPQGATFQEDTRRMKGFRHSAWVFFSGGDTTGLDRLIHPRLQRACLLDESGEFGRLFHEIALIGQMKGDAGFWDAQELLARMIRLFLGAGHVGEENYRLIPPGPVEAPDGFTSRVDDLIRDNLAGNLTLADIASALKVSVSQLSHQYHKQTGDSPMARHRRLRIDHARMLLMKGLPLKTIADQLGFADAFHLSKSFKKAQGCSPRQYIKSSRG